MQAAVPNSADMYYPTTGRESLNTERGHDEETRHREKWKPRHTRRPSRRRSHKDGSTTRLETKRRHSSRSLRSSMDMPSKTKNTKSSIRRSSWKAISTQTSRDTDNAFEEDLNRSCSSFWDEAQRRSVKHCHILDADLVEQLCKLDDDGKLPPSKDRRSRRSKPDQKRDSKDHESSSGRPRQMESVEKSREKFRQRRRSRAMSSATAMLHDSSGSLLLQAEDTKERALSRRLQRSRSIHAPTTNKLSSKSMSEAVLNTVPLIVSTVTRSGEEEVEEDDKEGSLSDFYGEDDIEFSSSSSTSQDEVSTKEFSLELLPQDPPSAVPIQVDSAMVDSSSRDFPKSKRPNWAVRQGQKVLKGWDSKSSFSNSDNALDKEYIRPRIRRSLQSNDEDDKDCESRKSSSKNKPLSCTFLHNSLSRLGKDMISTGNIKNRPGEDYEEVLSGSSDELTFEIATDRSVASLVGQEKAPTFSDLTNSINDSLHLACVDWSKTQGSRETAGDSQQQIDGTSIVLTTNLTDDTNQTNSGKESYCEPTASSKEQVECVKNPKPSLKTRMSFRRSFSNLFGSTDALAEAVTRTRLDDESSKRLEDHSTEVERASRSNRLTQRRSLRASFSSLLGASQVFEDIVKAARDYSENGEDQEVDGKSKAPAQQNCLQKRPSLRKSFSRIFNRNDDSLAKAVAELRRDNEVNSDDSNSSASDERDDESTGDSVTMKKLDEIMSNAQERRSLTRRRAFERIVHRSASRSSTRSRSSSVRLKVDRSGSFSMLKMGDGDLDKFLDQCQTTLNQDAPSVQRSTTTDALRHRRMRESFSSKDHQLTA